MKRFFFILGVALTLSLASIGTASASVSSLTLNAKADLSASQTSAVATGTIICTSGDSVDVQVVIIQSSGKVDNAGAGDATVTCTGQVQTWAVVVNSVTAPTFKHGPANAILSAFDSTDNTSFPTQAQGIKL